MEAESVAEEEGDGGGEVLGDGGSDGNSLFCARFAVLGVAFNKDGGDIEAVPEVDVGKGVADHETGGGGDIGKSGQSLVEHSGKGLAAVAGVLVVGAEVEGIDGCAQGGELGLEMGVDIADSGRGVFAEGDASLIGDDDNAEAGGFEAGDCREDAGEELETIEGGAVLAFGQLAVDDAVTVEKDSAQLRQGRERGGVGGGGGHGYTTRIPTGGWRARAGMTKD